MSNHTLLVITGLCILSFVQSDLRYKGTMDDDDSSPSHYLLGGDRVSHIGRENVRTTELTGGRIHQMSNRQSQLPPYVKSVLHSDRSREFISIKEDHTTSPVQELSRDGQLQSRTGQLGEMSSVPSNIDGNEGYPTDSAKTAKLYWHVGIYDSAISSNTELDYNLICGGSLVTPTAVISAAQCFWDYDIDGRITRLTDLGWYIVKSVVRAENDYEQNSQIEEVKVPPRFRGRGTNYQDDIAVVKLTTPFYKNPEVKPICVNFDVEFDKQQLNSGKGNVGSWLILENEKPSLIAETVKIQYIPIEKYMNHMTTGFLKYFTSEKICGKPDEGEVLCRWDNGAGMVFLADEVPYLRGVVSIAPSDISPCNAFDPVVFFTHIQPHKEFLLEHIPDLEDTCSKNYPQARFTNKSNSKSDNKCDNRKTINFTCNCNCVCNNSTSLP